MRIHRDSVLEAAVRLLAADPGASMQDIAEAASISRASLHRLYPTRDALVDEIAARAVKRVAAALDASRLDDGTAREAIARLTDAAIPIVHKFAFLAAESRLQTSESARREDRAVDDRITRLFQRGQEEGALRADLPAAWLRHAYGWLLYAAAVATTQGDIAPREAARLVLSTFLDGAARSLPRPPRTD